MNQSLKPVFSKYKRKLSQIQTSRMSHPSWIFNESPIFASSFSQRAPRRQHGDELSSLSFLLCTFRIHYPKYMLYIICSLYTFPKNIYFHYTFENNKLPKQGKKGCSLQALMILVLLLSCLLVCLRKHESWIVASRDLAKLLTELSRDWVRTSRGFLTSVRENAINLFIVVFIEKCQPDN